MNKNILLSIKPEHLKNILNGKKSLELRKSVPKNFKGWVYLYCTLGDYNLVHDGYTFVIEKGARVDYDLNGKVVARFWFDDFYRMDRWQIFGEYFFQNITLSSTEYHENLDELCLNREDILSYAENKSTLYAWRIKQLEIFDKPMELRDFRTKNNVVELRCQNLKHQAVYASMEEIHNSYEYTGYAWGCITCMNDGDAHEMYITNNYSVKRAPQSYQYVYLKEGS